MFARQGMTVTTLVAMHGRMEHHADLRISLALLGPPVLLGRHTGQAPRSGAGRVLWDGGLLSRYRLPRLPPWGPEAYLLRKR